MVLQRCQIQDNRIVFHADEIQWLAKFSALYINVANTMFNTWNGFRDRIRTQWNAKICSLIII